MPRYLGLDYLHEAKTARHQFFNKSLLTVPRHLEYVEKYYHLGFISDCLYRMPWNRAKADESFLEKEGKMVSSDLEALTRGHCMSGVERLSKQSTVLEFIPSSNPGSQDSFPGVIAIVEDSDNNDPHNSAIKEEPYQETFVPYVLSSCVTSSKDLLEEVITLREPLEEYLLKLPSLHNLLSCLDQYTVKDPLLEYDSLGKPMALLSNDRQLEEDSGRQEEDKSDHKSPEETFTKLPLETSGDLLEETICTTELEPLSDADFLSELSALCRPEVIKNEPELREVFQNFVETTPGIHMMSKTEQGRFSPCYEQTESIIGIIKGSEFKEAVSVDSMLLEIPLTQSPGLREIQSSLTQGAVAELTYLDIQLDEKECCLTPRERERLHQLYWREEKLLNETLELCLTEPFMPEPEMHTESLTDELVHLLSLTILTHSIEEELSLPWDPLSLVRDGAVKQQFAEKIKLNWTSGDLSQQNGNLPILAWTEKLEKYPAALLDDQSCPVLEPQSTSVFDTVRNSILDRQKREKLLLMPRRVKSGSRARPPRAAPYSQEKRAVVKKSVSDKNPLEDFLWMMRSEQGSSPSTVASRTDSSDSIYQQCTEKTVPSDTTDREKVVSVTMSEDYAEAAKLLSECSQEALQHLHEKGILPPHQHLATLPPDMTRFLVKQMEKQGKEQNCYTDMLVVHVVTCVYDIYLHCSLETAIFCLSALEERYQQSMGSSIVELGRKLFQLEHKLKANHCLHPKIKKMCAFIEEWFGKQNGKQQTKVLVIVKRDVERLLSELCETLASYSHVRPVIITHNPGEQDPADLLNMLDQVDCVISPAQAIQKTFPWSLFNLVVEYEYHPQAGWQSIANQHSIWYLALKLDPNRVSVGAGLARQNNTTKIVLIGSQKLTAETQLLQLLENRFNIIIVERDFSSLQAGRSYLHFADITLDGTSGICLHSLADIISPVQLEEMCNKLISLHQKYTYVCLILYPPSSSSKSFPPLKSTNIVRLQNALSQFSSAVEDFVVKIVVCEDMEEVAMVISKIGEEVLHSQTVEDVKHLTEEKEMTPEEKYLLAFPCFNSISAQLMLTKTTLEELMLMNAADLMLMFPSLPVKVIQRFLELRANMSDPPVCPLDDKNVTESRLGRRPDEETVEPGLGQSGTIQANLYQSRTIGPDLYQSQTMGPDLHQSQTTGPDLHQSPTTGPDLHQSHTTGPDLHQSQTMGPDLHQSQTMGPDLHQSSTMGLERHELETIQLQPHQIQPHPSLHIEQEQPLQFPGQHPHDTTAQHPRQSEPHPCQPMAPCTSEQLLANANPDSSLGKWSYCDENEHCAAVQIARSPPHRQTTEREDHITDFPCVTNSSFRDTSDGYNCDFDNGEDLGAFNLSKPNEFTMAEMEGHLMMSTNQTPDSSPHTPAEPVSGLTLTDNWASGKCASNQQDRYKPAYPWAHKGGSFGNRIGLKTYGTTARFCTHSQIQGEVARRASLDILDQRRSPPMSSLSKVHKKKAKTSAHDYELDDVSSKYLGEFLCSLKHLPSEFGSDQKSGFKPPGVRSEIPDHLSAGRTKKPAPVYSTRYLRDLKCTVRRGTTAPNAKLNQHAVNRNSSRESDSPSSPRMTCASDVSGYCQEGGNKGPKLESKSTASYLSGFSHNSLQPFQEGFGFRSQKNNTPEVKFTSDGRFPVSRGYSVTAGSNKRLVPSDKACYQQERPGHNMQLQVSYSHPAYQQMSCGLTEPPPRSLQLNERPAPCTNVLMEAEEDSPPMDLDSDEDCPVTNRPGTNDYLAGSRCHAGNRCRFPPPARTTGPNDTFEGADPGMHPLIPPKMKRLGLERMPGAKDGQTRLSFS